MTQLSFTYTSIILALQTWLDDFDTDLSTAVQQQCVQLAEIRLIDDLDLTVFSEVSTATLAASASPAVLANSFVARPGTVLLTDAMFYKAAATGDLLFPMERRDQSFLMDYLNPAVKGPPKYYAESDTTNWQVAPYTDVSTYTLVAYGPNAAQSLIDTSGTTWMSTNAAEVLWEAVLIQAAIFLKNQARQQEHMAMYNSFLTSLRRRFRSLRRNIAETASEQNTEKPAGQTPASKET